MLSLYILSPVNVTKITLYSSLLKVYKLYRVSAKAETNYIAPRNETPHFRSWWPLCSGEKLFCIRLWVHKNVNLAWLATRKVIVAQIVLQVGCGQTSQQTKRKRWKTYKVLSRRQGKGGKLLWPHSKSKWEGSVMSFTAWIWSWNTRKMAKTTY